MLKQPSPQTETRLQLVFVVLIIGLFALEIIRDYQPAKLSALFCIVFWIPLLALHEFGHAACARLFGCHVYRVVIGYGRHFTTVHAWGTPVELRRFPVEGFVQFHSLANLARWKRALIYFAGPGIELALLGVVTLAVGIDTMLSPSTAVSILAAQSLAICVLLSAIINLFPHRSSQLTNDNGCRTPNDGLGIVLSLLGRVD